MVSTGNETTVDTRQLGTISSLPADLDQYQVIQHSLQEITEACERISRFSTIYLSLFDEDESLIPAGVNFPIRTVTKDKLPEGSLNNIQTLIVVKDLNNDPRMADQRKLVSHLCWRTWMAYPIRNPDNELIGAISFASPHSLNILPRSRSLIRCAARMIEEHIFEQTVVDNIHSTLLNNLIDYLQRETTADVMEENKFLEHLFEQSSEGIFLIKNGEFIDCNRRATEMFSCDKSTLLNKTPMHFSPRKQPDGSASAQRAQTLLNRALSGEEQSFEWKHETADGDSFWVDITLSPLEYSGDQYLQAILREITEKKQLRNQLQRTVNQFRQSLEATAHEVVVTERDGTITYTSERIHDLWNISDVQLENRHVDQFFDRAEEKLKEPNNTDDSDNILNVRTTGKTNGKLTLHDGRYLHYFSHPITMEQQTIGRIWGFRNVTEDHEQRQLIDQYADFYRKNPEPVFLIDHNGELAEANEACEPLLDHWSWQETGTLPGQIQAMAEKAQRLEERLQKDIQLDDRTYSLIFAPRGQSRQVNVYGREITARKESEEQLRQTKERYKSLIEANPDIVYRLNSNSEFEFISHEITELGYSKEELVGRHFSYLLTDEDIEKCSRRRVVSRIRNQESNPGDPPNLFDERRTGERSTRGLEVTIQSKDNTETDRVFEVNSSGLYSGEGDEHDEFLGTVGVIRDITSRKQRERKLKKARKKLRKLSYHDQLTGLKNRRYFNDTLAEEWNQHRRQESELGLLMVDIDHFKIYNDTYGHVKGDDCLKKLTSIMEEVLNRSSDVLARYGGEEFGIILPESDLQGCEILGERLLKAIRQQKIPFPDSPVSDVVTVSIGAASVIPRSDQQNRLIDLADKALYNAKESGRNQLESLEKTE